MKKSRLGDLATLITKGTTPTTIGFSFVDTGVNFVKIESISENGEFLSDKFAHITDECDNKLKRSQLEENDILFSIAGAIGRTAIVPRSILPANTNQALAIIRIPQNAINLRFVLYALQSQAVEEQSEKQKQGVAQLNLSLKNIADILIPLVSSEKQDEIVRNLAAVDTAIAIRKEQIRLIDQVVKSRFIELFGDMFLNSKAWMKQALDSLADVVSGITKGRKTKEPQLIEVPYMAVSNVKDGYIDWTTVKTIQATQQEIEQYRLLPDDVLMTEGGDPDKLGRGAILKEPLQNCIHQNHIFRVRLNESLILPAFFEEYLKHQKAKRYFLGCAKQTTGIASINMRQLKALPVLLPPLELQEQFAAFVEQTDKSKVAVQKALDEAQLLFDSLMQKYFG